MHSYLLIGQGADNFRKNFGNLADKLHAKIMEFPLIKIGDVRSLNNLIRLSFSEPTLIVCQNIHEAGEEALNAFLKNLEEPQENIYFVLTAPSVRKVLPTIVSRCEVIRTMVTLRDNNSQFTINNDEASKFTKLTTGEKLAYIDKIKDRDKAIELAESLANFLHSSLHKNELKYSMQAKNLESVAKTLSGLKANGNVNLQLSNLVAKLI
jgi:DNA polymerase III delta prime subunit